MRRLVLAALAAACLAAPAGAQERRPELDGPSQGAMNAQAQARYRIADRELNAVYRKLLAAASPNGQARLRAAQRAWIRFRDLDCEARAGARGGSFHPAARLLCLEGATDQRTAALEAELDCEEGDMACGGVRSEE